MDIELFLEALPIVGYGYFGIFLVTGGIIGMVSLLKFFTDRGSP